MFIATKKKPRHVLLITLIVLAACAPKYLEPTKVVQMPKLESSNFHTPDGTILPIRTWDPPEEENAVLIALHGFNDYSNFFDSPGKFLKARGILSYAYDQRGFAFTTTRGLWSGSSAYVDDLTIHDLEIAISGSAIHYLLTIRASKDVIACVMKIIAKSTDLGKMKDEIGRTP